MALDLVRSEDYEAIVGRDLEKSLRPQSLDDLIGQEDLKMELRIEVEAALMGEPLNHILLSGPPGLGKTSIAKLIANELDVEFVEAKGSDLKNPNDLMAIISPMLDGAILFVDEVHQLPKPAQEALYTAMEDYEVTITLGGGPTAKVIKHPLPRFVMIGATTETGKLLEPLYARFGFQGELELYSVEELKRITARSARAKNVLIEERAAELIAERSHGTPRDANSHLDRLKRYAKVNTEGKVITAATAQAFFDGRGLDNKGLTRTQRQYLFILCDHFQGGPVGVVNLGAKMRKSNNSIAQLERELIATNMIIKNQQGRTATEDAYEHLGMKRPETPDNMVPIWMLNQRFR